MKKYFTIFAVMLLSSFCFGQNLSQLITRLNTKKGDSVPAFVKGQVVYAQKDANKVKKSDMNIPEEISDGVLILNYSETYYYNGNKKTKTFQLIYTNVEPTKKTAKATLKNPIDVEEQEIICVSKGNTGVLIRDLTIDPYLASTSSSMPLEIGPYWYFDMETFLSNSAKYLSFQPITSKDDVITFSDGTEESFKQLFEKSNNDKVAALDVRPIKIQTVMNSSPVQKANISDFQEKKIHLQYMANMNLEVVIEHLGYKIHLFFPNNFEAYFKDEYTLGDPIWFFGNTLYVKNGELYLYGRDFTLENPDIKVNDIQNRIIMQNRILKNSTEQKKQDSQQNQQDYVDMTVSVPKGGYVTYERFFYASDGKTFVENMANIEEKYYNAEDQLIAKTFRYDGTSMIRNTTTYKYDDKGRLIERCYYDSKMFQENGQWKVDPKMSRLFNKYSTTYDEKKDAVYAETVAYRYSYFPQTEHPDTIIYETFNKNNVLIHYEERDVVEQNLNEIIDYDDFGNEIYNKYNVEKPYEIKTEYVYDGAKILTATSTDLISNKVTVRDYSYDEKGNLKEVRTRDSENRREYKYNKNGKVIETTYYNDKGQMYMKLIYGYDKKTGLSVLKIEETYTNGDLSYARFWYTETKADGWKTDLNPWELAKQLSK